MPHYPKRRTESRASNSPKMKKTCLAKSIFFLAMLIEQSAAERTCPIMCWCWPEPDSTSSSLHTSCRWSGLTKVPELSKNITSISIAADTLNLQGYDFQDAENLREIELFIKTSLRIHRNTFGSLQRLVKVRILSTQFIHIESGAFTFNGSFFTVILKGNLTEVPSNHLCEHSKIRSLSIPDNQITSLKLTQCVEGWKLFNNLTVSHNPLRSVRGSDFYYLRDTPLKELHMSKCGLTALPSDLFRYTPMLEVLDLGQNSISSLPHDLFHNLDHLSQLFLDGTSLHGTPLHDNHDVIPHLKFLDLRYCKYMNISFGTHFRNATQMTRLKLGSTSIDLQKSTLANLNAAPLVSLYLDTLKLRSVAENALRPLRNLTDLHLKNTPINTTILHSMLTGISDHLQVISLIGTSLFELETKAFSSFSESNNLKGLTVRGNRMTVIHSKTFAPLKKLNNLDLSHNLLNRESLRKNCWFGLQSLEVLNLKENNLDVIPDQSLVGQLPYLRSLDLRKNSITLNSHKSLKDYVRLTTLNLCRNAIVHIGKNVFQSLTKLIYLDLCYNKIVSLDHGAFNTLQNLSYLGLNENNLVQIPVGVFGFLSQLKTLQLQGNDQVGLHANLSLILGGLTELETVTCSDCRISGLPLFIFNDNSNLSALWLSGNSIMSWHPDIFAPVKKLETLVLRNNRIINLSADLFKYLKSLQVLDLSYNPLACTCDLLWFTHWVNTVNVYMNGYLDKKPYVCKSPSDMKGVLINDFAMTPIDCTPKTLFYLLSGSVSIFILICMTLTLAYRYRWYIRYYRFLISARRRQARDALLEEERYQYDAYVCYHHTSRHWVIKNMLPELEYKGGIKLCLHDRDWLVGPFILDNIVDSLDKSRKTLLVITNEFVKSAWCREETTLAYHRLVQEKRNLLVVVLLENIRYADLNSSLRTILTSRTYLAWPTQTKKEKMFWKALRRALGKSESVTRQTPLGRP